MEAGGAFSASAQNRTLTIAALDTAIEKIVAKVKTPLKLDSIVGVQSFERVLLPALKLTPFGRYPDMLAGVYSGAVGWSQTDLALVERSWKRAAASRFTRSC